MNKSGGWRVDIERLLYLHKLYVMKTKMLFFAAALVALAGCSGNKQQQTAATDVNPVTDTDDRHEEYTGVLPAADTEGIEYTLHLEYDRDDNFTEGDYRMRQVYMSATNPTTYDTKGDFKVLKGTPQSPDQMYLQLVSDPENNAPADTTYFLVSSDSTLTMVGQDLTPAVSGLNYDLKLKK